MMKKAISFALALSLVFGTATAAFAATAPATEKDALGISFTGDEIKLTLDDAIARMTTTGPAFDAVMLTKKGNDAAAKGQFELISTIKELSSLPAQAQQIAAASGAPTSMNSLTGKQATLAKDFYKVYSPLAYEAGMNGIKNSTVQVYYGLLMSQENYRIAKETASIKETLYKNTQKKYNLGVASKMDLLLAETDYLSAQQSELEALSGLNSTRMSFNMAMNYDLMQNITLTDTLTLVEAPAIDLEASIKSALENRNDLIKAKYDMDDAELKFNSVKAYPRNSATYLGAEAAYSGAKLSYDMKRLTIELEIRQAYMNLQTLALAVKNAEATAANAKEAARLTQLQYDAGMCTITDLQTAQNNSAAAQLGVASAIMNYDLAVYSFEYNAKAGIL